jgi:hypothetical protein
MAVQQERKETLDAGTVLTVGGLVLVVTMELSHDADICKLLPH